MLALTLLLLTADPTPTAEPAPSLDAATRARLQAQYTQLEAERPTLRLPSIITGFGLLFVAFGAELIGGAWGWSRLNPSGAWNQATTRYLTASGTGYLLGGLTVSLTGAYLIFKAFRERRSVDVQLSEIQALLGQPG